MAADLYQSVTDKILASLEAGVAPWVKPWTPCGAHGGLPYNYSTGKAYRGINCALLYAPEYAMPAWMTYKQAQGIGGQVRKGERGSLIVFYKPFAVTDKNAAPDASGNRPEKFIPLLRAFTVFNVAQIDGLAIEPAAPVERPTIAAADSMLALATIRHGGNRAYYAPSVDAITLPQPAQFATTGDYYATALHELAHWTGHASRCDREYGKRFGDTAYGREELVAEMGAAFLCARTGIDGQLQHASYLQSWIDIIKADKRAIVVAASHAQKAADFVLSSVGATDAEASDAATEAEAA
jgi:antirestriction protein ArdC